MEPPHLSKDWCGYECKSGQVPFYYNKRSEENKWLSFSQQNIQDETTESDGPVHPKIAPRVTVGTQTEDTGCINGCTSIYFNKNMILNIKQEPLDRGYPDICSKNRTEAGCSLGNVNIHQSMDTEISSNRESAPGQSCNEEAFHVQEEDETALQVNANKEARTGKAIATDQTYEGVGASERLEMVPENINHVYTVKPTEKLIRNLKNVREIIIENPHHYIDTNVSQMSLRHAVEIKVTNESTSLRGESCVNPSIHVPSLDVTTPTGTPRDLSANRRSTSSPRHHLPIDGSTGVPRISPSAKVPREEVDPTTVFPRDRLPSECCIGSPKGGQSNQVQRRRKEWAMKGVPGDCSSKDIPMGIPWQSFSECITDMPSEHLSKEHFTAIPREHLSSRSFTRFQGACLGNQEQSRKGVFANTEIPTRNQVPSATTGFPSDGSPNESSTNIPKDCSPVESSPTDSSGVSMGLFTQQQTQGSYTSLATGIQHSAQQLTYTHIIHVDTAITSNPLDRSNTTAPTDYSVVYPNKQEVYPVVDREKGIKASHPKSVSEPRNKPSSYAPPNQPCNCPLCDALLPNTKTFFEHLFNHCDWTTRECAICKKTFSKKYGLGRHLQSHASYRPYKCIRCGKCFLRSHQLNSHMSTHDKDANVV